MALIVYFGGVRVPHPPVCLPFYSMLLGRLGCTTRRRQLHRACSRPRPKRRRSGWCVVSTGSRQFSSVPRDFSRNDKETGSHETAWSGCRFESSSLHHAVPETETFQAVCEFTGNSRR